MKKYAGECLVLATILLACLIQVAAPAKDKKPAQPKFQPQLVWPAPPEPARIKWVGELRNEYDVGAKKRNTFLDRLAGKGQEVLALYKPLSVAVDDQGVVYVGDAAFGVVVMDPVNHKMWSFSQVSNRKEQGITGVAVDAQFVFTTSALSDTVTLYDKKGQAIASIGTKDGVKRPVGIAVDEARNLVVVVNGGNHNVLLLDRKTLKVQKMIGSRGDGPAAFNYPTYCCFLPGTGFAVMDTMNFRVQVFDYQGRYIKSFGSLGDSPGMMSRPKGIAVDPDNHLYIADAAFNNIQVFNLEGQILIFFGEGGEYPGMFQLPNGIAIDKKGTIYVADEMNGRIQIFQYLKEGGEGSSTSATTKK